MAEISVPMEPLCTPNSYLVYRGARVTNRGDRLPWIGAPKAWFDSYQDVSTYF